MDPAARDLLTFWFGEAARSPQTLQAANRRWFGGDPAFDAELRDRFGHLHTRACRGQLHRWVASAHGTLALVLLLDQLSRNLSRGSAGAFAQDERAQALTLEALDAGRDALLAPIERAFLLMPLQHAEKLALQERSVAEYARLRDEAGPEWREYLSVMLDFAREHQVVIRRFGRFPHRNGALGRSSTAEEQAYLEGGAARWGQ